MSTVRRFIDHRFGLVVLLALVFVVISFLTRLALVLQTPGFTGMSSSQLAGIFAIGFVYDLAISSYLVIPLVLYLWLVNERVFSRKLMLPVAAVYLAAILIIACTNIVPREFNEALYKALLVLVILQFAKYLLMAWKGPVFRKKWRRNIIHGGFFLVVFLLLFNAVSEWFFYNEFSTRYNFIAVDYLIYTTEVIGNIKESYPLGLIITAIVIVSVLIMMLARKQINRCLQMPLPFAKRTAYALPLLTLPVIANFFVQPGWKHFSSNAYANELAGNGLYDFGVAFTANELDYYRFYTHISDEEAFKIVRKELASPYSRYTGNNPFSVEREINYPGPEKRMNVVLISVESLSAEFMESFGSMKRITPNLDSLAEKSVFFTNLYASGTRTVRGLEALSLSIPPTPGQSVVKRPQNADLFSLGSVFRSKGYITQYLYGGYGYFDNMNTFFANNQYQVIDRSALDKREIHYSNIWGVADEDLFTLTLKTLDSNYHSGKPFFTHVMTVSNHRPYTYPDGRIDIPPSRQVREGAVKYTDYAIGKFLHDAGSRPWFNNTLFVIAADHCAGSAGSVELPVTGYHIPLILYSPANLQPRKVNRLMAQIDIPPTILGLLSFDYRSKFFGYDIFAVEPGHERAFLSTYEGLGYLKGDRMVIQSPVKSIEEVKPDFQTGMAVKTKQTDSLVKEAIAWYQCASWLLKHNKYSRN